MYHIVTLGPLPFQVQIGLPGTPIPFPVEFYSTL